jgi:hypothetical protein
MIQQHLPLPNSDALVVRRRAESSVFVKECNRVHGTQVTVVFLQNIATARIPLNYFFVLHSRQKDVLLVFIRIEFDTKSPVTSVKALFDLT